MDETLANLLVQFWMTGDRDTAKVLADRLQELPAEQVAEALVEFRRLVVGLPYFIEAMRRVGESMAGAVGAIGHDMAEAVPQQEQENFPL
jgi:hypothetical protein